MKANRRALIIAKKRVELLKGQDIRFAVNEGRNRIARFEGKICDMYDGIFTIEDSTNDKIRSYPYSEIITENVKFYRK